MKRPRWAMMTATYRRRVAVVFCSVMTLGLGITLVILAFLGPTPPDPATADGDALTAFLASDSFLDLSSGQREAFYRGLADRYLAMDATQRVAFEESWRKHRKAAEMRRQIEAQMALSLIRRITDQYVATPVDQRGFYLNGVLLMLRTTNGPLSREFRTWSDGNPVEQRVGDPQKMAEGIRNYKRDILAATNADERAVITQFAGDLLEHARLNR